MHVKQTVRHALDNMQKCVPKQKSVFDQTGRKEREERGTGSEEAELQATF